jgi:hypothetical protein
LIVALPLGWGIALAFMHRRRSVGAALALVGMALYAMLFPWHTVSQTSMLLAQAGLSTSAVPICHTEAPGDPAKPAQPTKQTHCPICNGFAALQFALAGASIALVLPAQPSGKHAFGAEDHLADAVVQAAQSRGPPPHTA